MTLAFVTMVWQDHWLLRKWVDHNAKAVPRRQLYVLNHGGDPVVDRIAAGCNVIHIPRGAPTPDLTRRRWDLLAGTANGLLAFHDRVVVSDVDELLLTTDDQRPLATHLAYLPCDTSAIAAIGVNLWPENAPGTGGDVLAGCPTGLVSAKYTKPCVLAQPVEFTAGGHGLVKGDFRVDPGLVLCHLHFVTPDYGDRMAARQTIVSRAMAEPTDMPQRKRHWINWSNPDMVVRKTRQRYARAREVEVPQGFSDIARQLERHRLQNGRRMVIDPRVDDTDPMRIIFPPAFRHAI